MCEREQKKKEKQKKRKKNRRGKKEREQNEHYFTHFSLSALLLQPTYDEIKKEKEKTKKKNRQRSKFVCVSSFLGGHIRVFVISLTSIRFILRTYVCMYLCTHTHTHTHVYTHPSIRHSKHFVCKYEATERSS